MENKEWCELFRAYGLNTLFVDMSDDGDGELELTEEGKRFIEDLLQKLENSYIKIIKSMRSLIRFREDKHE